MSLNLIAQRVLNRKKITMNNTEKMLNTLLGMGHLVGYDPETAAKKIPHQKKMVLLRFWNNYKQYDDYDSFNRFLDKWLPVRKYLEERR